MWVEGLGWYQARDCGSAIKGFHLDVLTATEADAMKYGKQDRFVIVVPEDAARNRAASSAAPELAVGPPADEG